MSQTVILVSPAPVDAYPPVLYQARILADAGYRVELLSQPLPSYERINFQHPGVHITEWSPPAGGKPRLAAAFANGLQLVRYMAALSVLRLRAKPVAEIAFDPNGILVSDYALFRPRRRIAHLHETVQRMDEVFIERRLKKAFAGYQRIAVADQGRAELCFQLLDARRQGRLGDETGLGGPTEMPVFRQSHQISPLPQGGNIEHGEF